MKFARTSVRFLTGAIAAAGVMCALLVAPALPAQAATNPTAGFDAGNIISDSLFYDGTSMSTADVQSFLNTRVPACWLGRSGYEVGKKVTWGGVSTQLASKCSKDYTITTSSKAANKYCKAYTGITNEKAAAIIAKVGAACGISPKVLLVMLEKEQSLITDPWPNNEQYRRAMGYACPDTGPNGTAQCDPTKGGFFEQVYRAAWQLNVYKALNSNYNFHPFKSNYIQYHPNRDCGGSNVYIDNWATASLYIYTPYQPNRASLEAGVGEGDSCSAYGNRNFYVMYKGWFGQPNAPEFAVTGKIFEYWKVQQSWLGQPKANAVTLSANRGGSYQVFSGGTVYAPNSGDVTGIVAGKPLANAYSRAGGPAGAWGWPVQRWISVAEATGTMKFQNGVVSEKKGVGVYFVPNSLATTWMNKGGVTGTWGYATASATTSSGATHQVFSKGAAGVKAGAVSFTGAPFGAAWLQQGGLNGKLGAPVGAVTKPSGGSAINFAGGSMFSKGSTASNIWTIPKGRILTAYLNAGGPTSTWGWPIGKQLCTSDARECSMPVESGVLVWTADRGFQFTPSTANLAPSAKPGSGESVTGGVVR